MKYECPCGYVYDPALGDPENGVAPARHGKMSPKIGFAPHAVSEKMLFTPLNN